MVRVRLAPSPTGEPHIGNMYTALINFVFARQNKGKFILRIEDTDRSRFMEGAEEMIIESLKWLGLEYDEGPYRQSERLSFYWQHAQKLIKMGKAYYCFCLPARLEKMRQTQKAKGQPPRYDGICRKLNAVEVEKRLKNKEPYVIRLKVPESGETTFEDLIRGRVTFENKLLDDQILLKSDGYPTYHLAVVVDDYLMKISHVIRAEEWLSSTPKHVLLYQAFGWELPFFAHLPLLRNPDHSKLSKRRNPVSVLWYRRQGYLPETLLNFLATMGWSDPQGREIFSLSDLIKNFSLERVGSAGPIFNLEKLDWMNGEYLRQKNLQELLKLACEWAQYTEFKIRTHDEDYLLKILALVGERMKKLSEFPELTDFFFLKPAVDPDLLAAGKGKAQVKTELAASFEALKGVSWKAESLEKTIRQVAKDLKIKESDLFMTLRVALTGKTATPPLFETMEILGKEETLLRLEKIYGKSLKFIR